MDKKEYIERGELIEKIFPMGVVDDGRYAIPAKAVKVAIDRMSAADVVPRAEVERLVEEIFEEIEKHKTVPFGSKCEVIPFYIVSELKKKYEEKQNG